uniref:Protein kinase domain-containing protein n=1 Tax=Oryza brachyantha TaxID=4533 RepID=J3N6U1_ORYBR
MNPADLTYQLLEEITDGFSEERRLGRGGFGTVYKGVHKNGEQIAVKILHNDTEGIDDTQLNNEFDNLTRFKHPNIVQLVGYCYDRLMEEKFLLKEYLEGSASSICLAGALKTNFLMKLMALTGLYGTKLLKGTCEGLKYLHVELKPHIYHLDLKPANILLDSNMVPKIADSGLSKIFSGGKTKVVGNWKNRLQKKRNDSLLEAYFQQVKTCTEIALKCLETDREKRPTIAEIISEINEKEAMFGEVLGNWTIRLMAQWNGSSLKANLHQVKACTEIALECLETDGHRRPDYCHD